MKTVIKSVAAMYSAASIRGYLKASSFVRNHATALLAIAGVVLLSGGLAQLSHAVPSNFGSNGQALTNSFSEAHYDDSLVRGAVGNLFLLIEGPFGALIMVVLGLGAIVAAAMGAYRAAVGMLVVAVGAFILRSLVSLFFGTDYDAPAATGSGGIGGIGG